MGNLISRVVKTSGLGKQSQLDRLRGVWREAVGRKNAEETRLASFRSGVLTVEVSSSSLAHELGVYYERELLARLRQASNVPIQQLKFRVSGGTR